MSLVKKLKLQLFISPIVFHVIAILPPGYNPIRATAGMGACTAYSVDCPFERSECRLSMT